MLAMLMLIPTMTGGPEGTEEKLLWHEEKTQRNADQLTFVSSPWKVRWSCLRTSAVDVASWFISIHPIKIFPIYFWTEGLWPPSTVWAVVPGYLQQTNGGRFGGPWRHSCFERNVSQTWIQSNNRETRRSVVSTAQTPSKDWPGAECPPRGPAVISSGAHTRPRERVWAARGPYTLLSWIMKWIGPWSHFPALFTTKILSPVMFGERLPLGGFPFHFQRPCAHSHRKQHGLLSAHKKKHIIFHLWCYFWRRCSYSLPSIEGDLCFFCCCLFSSHARFAFSSFSHCHINHMTQIFKLTCTVYHTSTISFVHYIFI